MTVALKRAIEHLKSIGLNEAARQLEADPSSEGNVLSVIRTVTGLGMWSPWLIAHGITVLEPTDPPPPRG